MKIPIKTVLIFIIAGLSGTLLLYTSQAVQDAQRDLNYKTRELAKEKEALATLRAEWAFLSAPERLQRIAEDNLGMSLEAEASIIPNLKTLKNNTATQDASYDASYKDKRP